MIAWISENERSKERDQSIPIVQPLLKFLDLTFVSADFLQVLWRVPDGPELCFGVNHLPSLSGHFLLLFSLFHFLGSFFYIVVLLLQFLLRLFIDLSVAETFSCRDQIQEFIFIQGLNSVLLDDSKFAGSSVIS